MPLRALALRTAMERATDAPAVLAVGDTIRITTPAPDGGHPAWLPLLTALRTADRWGSSGTDTGLVVWAEIDDPEGQR